MSLFWWGALIIVVSVAVIMCVGLLLGLYWVTGERDRE